MKSASPKWWMIVVGLLWFLRLGVLLLASGESFAESQRRMRANCRRTPDKATEMARVAEDKLRSVADAITPSAVSSAFSNTCLACAQRER